MVEKTSTQNPIKTARTKAGRTLVQFAEDVGVHYQAVYLNECGVYAGILPAILNYLGTQGYDQEELEGEYLNFVRSKREDMGEKVELTSLTELGEPGYLNPFTQFRESLRLNGAGLTRSKFCKLFCVHPALIRKLELGETKTLPGQLVAALMDAGLSSNVLDELEARLEEQVGARANWEKKAAS